MRESARQKAGRILCEGRLVVVEAGYRVAFATCRGEGRVTAPEWRPSPTMEVVA